MPRWLAICTADGLDNPEKFREQMAATKNWRPDARTKITTVLHLGDGKLLAECHSPSQDAFDAWLEQKGWNIESITPIQQIAKTGSIWDGQKP